jgi:hypothetical protein
MPEFEVAHLREQGQNMIVVPLSSSFGSKSEGEKADIIDEIERRAHAAGLAGTAVAVWESGFGGMGFIAPRPWHPFFQSIDLSDIARSINHRLYW